MFIPNLLTKHFCANVCLLCNDLPAHIRKRQVKNLPDISHTFELKQSCRRIKNKIKTSLDNDGHEKSADLTVNRKWSL